MQELILSATTDRTRSSTDELLRAQLDYIAARGMAGNRGRGWAYELGSTINTESLVNNPKLAHLGRWRYTTTIRFYRRVDVDGERFKRQSADILEWAAATGHSTRFSARPWIVTAVGQETGLADGPEAETELVVDTDTDTDTDEAYIPMREVGSIVKGKFFDHLYGLDSQITVLLSALQAASDSDMANRFHTLLFGEPGCLSSDTFIPYNVISTNGRCQNSKGGTIENLFHRFHNIPRRGKGRYQRPETIGSNYYVTSCDDAGKMSLNRIVNVIDSGVKAVYALRTVSGREIKATYDHRFMTESGYVELGGLSVGQSVLINPGKPSPSGGRKPSPYRREVFVKQHATAKIKIVNGCVYRRLRVYQAVYEAHFNGMSYVEYIRLLNSCTAEHAARLWAIPSGHTIHHKDENINNNDFSNLVLVPSESDHVLEYDLEASKLKVAIYAEPEEVASIGYVSEEQVYDIVMAAPYHNFTASGFVVHNCGKTEILQSTSRLLTKLGVSHQLLDATSTTEAGMRKMLLDEDAVLPEVFLIEEIEKTPENSLRWLLGIMDIRGTIQQTNYRKSASRRVPAIVLATANDIDLLKRMMYGALHSRFQHEVYCPRPDKSVLRMILEREIVKVNGAVAWIEPTLAFMCDERLVTDPRKIIPVCLCGKESLLDGTYQNHLRKTMGNVQGQLTGNPESQSLPAKSTVPNIASIIDRLKG